MDNIPKWTNFLYTSANLREINFDKILWKLNQTLYFFLNSVISTESWSVAQTPEFQINERTLIYTNWTSTNYVYRAFTIIVFYHQWVMASACLSLSKCLEDRNCCSAPLRSRVAPTSYTWTIEWCKPCFYEACVRLVSRIIQWLQIHRFIFSLKNSLFPIPNCSRDRLF